VGGPAHPCTVAGRPAAERDVRGHAVMDLKVSNTLLYSLYRVASPFFNA
jgi:hypothetical protein